MAGPDPLATFHAALEALLEGRDVDGFMALWAADDDITLWGSELHERDAGRDQIRAHAQAIVDSGKDLRFDWDDTSVHVEGEVAWVRAAGAANGSPYRLTVVLVRRSGEWRLHTFSGSEPR